MIHRLYKGLYIYTVGFFHLISLCTLNSSNKNNTIISIWKVFSIILDHVCQTDNRNIIGTMQREYQNTLNLISTDYNQKLTEKDLEIKNAVSKASKYMKDYEDSRKEIEEINTNIKSWKEQVDNLCKQNEDEKVLRIQIEQKMSTLLSNHLSLKENVD